MRIKSLVFFLAAALCVDHAGAVGTLIKANGAKDMVYDEQRDIVYITSGNQVLRYDVSGATFLTPIALGGHLLGIDLSPDEKTLAIADQSHTSTSVWLHLVDADTLVDDKQTFKTPSVESGTFSVAYGANGDLLETESLSGSGWTPMRRLQASTGQWSILTSPRQNTMVSASGDGNVIAYAQANISSGDWGRYDVQVGQLSGRPGTNGFNYDVAVNATARQYFVQFSGGAKVFNSSNHTVASWDGATTGAPIGGAFHPVKALAYFPWGGTSEVRIFDSATFEQTGSLDFETPFNDPGIFAYQTYNKGRTKLSRDGSLLMVSVAGGVRIYRMYAPLTAANESASIPVAQPVAIPVSARLGIHGTISYGIAVQPAHGTASINGSTITYTPGPSFNGTDTFDYQAHYGRAVANGTINVSVNRPPVAVDDHVMLQGASPARIDVLANDSDPDNDALSIIAVAQPSAGNVAIQGNELLYTPPASGNAITNFKYTISDGHGRTASAQVYVVVRTSD